MKHVKVTALLLLIWGVCFAGITQVDWNTQVKNKPSLPPITVVCSDSTFAGAIFAATGSFMGWNASTLMKAPADGQLLLQNNALTGFTSISLGGITSSFPMIKVSGAALSFRLADDTGDAAIAAGAITASGAIVSTAGDQTIAATAKRIWSGLTKMSAPADGKMLLTNNAGTAFTMLQMGGTTASFVGLKSNGSVLQAKLADDSDWAPLQVGALLSNYNLTVGAGFAAIIGGGSKIGSVGVTVNSATQFDGYHVFNNTNTAAELVGGSASNDNGTLALNNGGARGVTLVGSGPSSITGGTLGHQTLAFSSLGSVPAAGTEVYCTNCTTAATCAAGGSGHMAISNGTNWTCQ